MFESALFDQYFAISQKRWKANRNLYGLYQKELFPMTLRDS